MSHISEECLVCNGKLIDERMERPMMIALIASIFAWSIPLLIHLT